MTTTAIIKPARPFLTCANSKGHVLPELLKRMPKEFNRYHEPFFGSGALFFRLQPDDARIADIRRELILTLRTVRERPAKVAGALRRFKNTESFYRSVVKQHVENYPATLRAARHIYLNRTSTPGWDYEDNAGRFAAPYGNLSNVVLDEVDLYKDAARVLKKEGVAIEHASFELCAEGVDDNDFVYLDPPHFPGEAPNTSSVCQDGFAMRDHRVLASVVQRMTTKGAKVLLTCTDLPEIEALYKGYEVDRYAGEYGYHDATGSVCRKMKTELVIRNYS